jgi:hypothetical protein
MSPWPPEKPEATTLSQTYRDLQGAGSDQCPSAEALAAAAVGDAPASERDRIADHAVSCRRCSEDLQILMRTHLEATGASAAPRPMRRMMWLSAAAVAVIAAGAVFVLRTSRPVEVVRGSRALREAALVTPRDNTTLSAAPEKLIWPAQPGAEGYRAKLFDASGQAIWESERIAEPSVTLSASAAASVRPGQGYFWTVEVELPLEKQHLGPYSFTLRR